MSHDGGYTKVYTRASFDDDCMGVCVEIPRVIGSEGQCVGPYHIIANLHADTCGTIAEQLSNIYPAKPSPESFRIIWKGRSMSFQSRLRDLVLLDYDSDDRKQHDLNEKENGPLRIKLSAVLKRKDKVVGEDSSGGGRGSGKEEVSEVESGSKPPVSSKATSGNVCSDEGVPSLVSYDSASPDDEMPTLFSCSGSISDSSSSSSSSSSSDGEGTEDSGVDITELHEQIGRFARRDAFAQFHRRDREDSLENVLFESSLAANALGRSIAVASRNPHVHGPTLATELRQFSGYMNSLASVLEAQGVESLSRTEERVWVDNSVQPSPDAENEYGVRTSGEANAAHDRSRSRNANSSQPFTNLFNMASQNMGAEAAESIRSIIGSLTGGNSRNSNQGTAGPVGPLATNPYQIPGGTGSGGIQGVWDTSHSDGNSDRDQSAPETSETMPTSVDRSRSVLDEARLIIRLAILQKSRLPLTRLLAGVVDFSDPRRRISDMAATGRSFSKLQSEVFFPFQSILIELMRVTSVNNVLNRRGFRLAHLDTTRTQGARNGGGGVVRKIGRILKSYRTLHSVNPGHRGMDAERYWPSVISQNLENSTIPPFSVDDAEFSFTNPVRSFCTNLGKLIVDLLSSFLVFFDSEATIQLETPDTVFRLSEELEEKLISWRNMFVHECVQISRLTTVTTPAVRVCRLLVAHILEHLPWGIECYETSSEQFYALAAPLTRFICSPSTRQVWNKRRDSTGTNGSMLHAAAASGNPDLLEQALDEILPELD